MTHMERLVSFAMALLCALALMVSCQKAPELTLTGPSSIELSADGGSGSFTFTANRDWTVSCSDSWLSVSPSSGTASDGPVSVTVRCNANTTYEDRSATVTVRMEELSRTVTVRQPANLGIIVATQSYDLAADARSLVVEVQANVQYNVEVTADWIKQTGSKALASKALTFDVKENTSFDKREGMIVIRSQQASVSDQVITVRQAQKDALIVSNSVFDVAYGGGEVEFKVDANVSFSVTSGADWIHYVSTKALTTSTVLLRIDENESFSARSGRVEVSQQGGSLRYNITVNQAGRIAVTSVELDKTELTLKPEETATLVATVKPNNATDKTVTWSSSDTSIASVDANGKVTAIKDGSATITATAGEKKAECKVTVCIPVSSVDLNKTTLEMKAGDAETLVATVKPDNASDKTVTWSSSDASIASVDANGKVTAIKDGSATITATAGEKKAECKVTVYIPVSSVELNKTTLEMKTGDAETLVATVKPDNASDKTVTWSSSDASIASVDANGKVTAIKDGSAIITAQAGGKSATCSVTVQSAPDGAVDLGILVKRADGSTYRLFWAECNIGADKPEEPGNFYAWGELTTKSSYDWTTYYRLSNGASNKLTKYCATDTKYLWDGVGEPDRKTVLEPVDDVAHVTLGGTWRMPTEAEMLALKSQCDWTWTTKGGVNGYEVKSRESSNSIFLPVAGFWSGAMNLLEEKGYYWSSSRDTSPLSSGAYYASEFAMVLHIESDHVACYSVDRSNGLLVRAVSE